MAKVSLKNVSKIYPGEKGGDVTAVKDFSLEIADREFVVLVGPSGCGKSTTLRMIAGLEEISKGDIYIGDKRVNDVAPKDRDIAMVFQNYALYPHMSVYDNLAFGLEAAEIFRSRKSKSGWSTPRAFSASNRCSIANRKRSPAASGNGSRSGARSCVNRRFSSLTNRSPISTPRCGCKCERKSSSSISDCRRR